MEKQFQEPESIRDAEAFLVQLKKIPTRDQEAGRLLMIGFMSGLDAAEATQATKLEAASK